MPSAPSPHAGSGLPDERPGSPPDPRPERPPGRPPTAPPSPPPGAARADSPTAGSPDGAPAGPQPPPPAPGGPGVGGLDGGPIRLSDEVAEALAVGRPVVALESTLIAHGLPRPRNLEVATGLEELLRDMDVTPATIGVIAGTPIVGLSAEQLDTMAQPQGVRKASVRDLPMSMAQGAHAATTVAATAYLAHRAGIAVFATGGLGGVHRGARDSFDESADLITLARTPVTVVCAGAKSVLDIPATLERLETLGIGVVGYRTGRFPGFYVSDSGHPLDHRVEGAGEVADVMAAARRLGSRAALVVANPVPAAAQLDPAVHDRVLTDALAAAERANLRGKPVTPFLLDHIRRETAGESLEANVAAIRNNAAVAGEIATAWSRRIRDGAGAGRGRR